MKRDRSYLYKDYLRDILENLKAAEEFTRGLEFEGFTANKQVQYAVIRALEIVGEAVKNVPVEVRRSHPQVPWKEMAGMRDRVIHGYRGVDLQLLWDAATVAAPKYLPLIEAMLRQEETRQ